jgi:hypothetical protein
LLGFGEKDSYVIIDDVLISSEIVNPPVAGNDTLTYSWEFGDRSEAVTSDQSSVTYTYTDDGIYTVTVSDNQEDRWTGTRDTNNDLNESQTVTVSDNQYGTWIWALDTNDEPNESQTVTITDN